MRAKYLSSGKTITTIVFGVLVLLVFFAFGAVKVSILHIENFTCVTMVPYIKTGINNDSDDRHRWFKNLRTSKAALMRCGPLNRM